MKRKKLLSWQMKTSVVDQVTRALSHWQELVF